MTNAVLESNTAADKKAGGARSRRLAERLEHGARSLADFARGLTAAQWSTAVPGDGRSIGVVVHHVASVYPIEIELALGLAANKAMTGVTWQVVHDMNADHAKTNAGVTKEAALDLLRRNSETAAATIRSLTDEQLDGSGFASLYADAPITCQFMLEDHAVRHSYHHLAKVKAALKA